MNVINSVDKIDVKCDLWHYLALQPKPVVMYGMGNGADKIIDALALFGVEVADFFASDAFVRGQSFHGKVVLTYGQVCEKYDDFVVLVSFGTRLPDVLAAVDNIAAERELYVPDVPVVCDDLAREIFTLETFEAHKSELAEVCDMLADERSRETFCDIILYRLTGRLDVLRRHECEPSEVYELLEADEIRSVADLGAYDGDSLRELAGFAPRLERAVALEPDARTFKKLTSYSETAGFELTCVNAAAWSEDCTLEFTSGANRNSSLASKVGIKTGAKVKSVDAKRLDSLVEAVDYIKYDVEGAEFDAILGSRGVIERTKPKLLVSLYHRTEDLHRLPKLLSELGYRELFLRRYEYIPAWEINLIAK